MRGWTEEEWEEYRATNDLQAMQDLMSSFAEESKIYSDPTIVTSAALGFFCACTIAFGKAVGMSFSAVVRLAREEMERNLKLYWENPGKGSDS